MPRGKMMLAVLLSALAGVMVIHANASDHYTQARAFPVEYREVRWSPDSKWLAVVMRTDPHSRFRIAVLPAEGGPSRWITPEADGGMMPRWSPDGRKIAYLTFPLGDRFDLKVINVDEPQTPTVLAEQQEFPYSFSQGYTWTADGKAFSYFNSGPGVVHGHHTIDLSGKDSRTVGTEGIPMMFGIEWSAELSRIAFAGSSDTSSGIYLAGPHGENPHEVVRPNGQPTAPALSPDGRTLLYCFYRKPTSGPTLWTAGADGGNAHSIAADGVRGQFSSDGQWIAYLDSRGVATPDNPSGASFFTRLCKARPDGSGVVVLAK